MESKTKTSRPPHYADDGMRLTDCCAAMSTFMDAGDGAEVLCCKACYHKVSIGQGDGNEYRAPTKQETRYRITNNDHGTNWVIGTTVAMYGDGWDAQGNAAFYFPEQGMAWGCVHAHESEVERID